MASPGASQRKCEPAVEIALQRRRDIEQQVFLRRGGDTVIAISMTGSIRYELALE